MDQARVQSGIERRSQLRFVVDDTAAGAGKRIRGSHDERIAGALGEFETLLRSR